MNKQEIKKLEQKIISIIHAQVKNKDKLILGISGGSDSVFLFHIMLLTKSKFICAHLNHNLRGSESDEDQIFCTKLCTTHNIPLYKRSIKIKNLSQKLKKGIEETGRNERYKFFNYLAKKHKASFIITAHHADDNVETILLNLIRGAGLSGISGMTQMQDNIFRPLLYVSKSEILDYLKSKKIPFREESSNKDTSYRRNFIRHEILPLILKKNPSFTKTISKNTLILKEIEDFLNTEAKKFLKNHSNPLNTQIDAKAFRKAHPSLQKQIIRNLTQKYDIKSINIDEIIDLIEKNTGNKEKTLKTIKIKIKSNIIQLEKIRF
jgi:tRNA(Ile)-lysidine synthase